MRFFIGIWALAFVILAAASSEAQLSDDVREVLEGRLEGLVDGIEPGVAVGVVQDGEIVFERYIGYANLEHEVPVTAASRFNIASNGKQYMALMVLALADEGRITLDADFRTYLPNAMPHIEPRITVRQLISHTSGIRDVYELLGLSGVTWYLERFRSREALALLDRQRALNFEPGSDYRYSNSNYILLAAIVSAVTDERFHVYAERFFAERDMSSTMVRRHHGEVVPNLARAYRNWSGWLEDPSIANTYGDGFFYSTLRDQLRWEAQVQGTRPSLAAGLVEASQTALVTHAEGQYGYGLERGNYRGLDTVFHVGSTGGYNAYVLRFPSEAIGVVVMSNSNEIGVVGLGNRIADDLLGEEAVAPAVAYPAGPDEIGAEPDLQAMIGRYETGDGTVIRLSVEDGALYRNIDGRDPVRMIQEAGNVFAYETLPDLKLVYTEPENAPAQFVLMMASQRPQTAIRLTDPPQEDAYFEGLAGRYFNDEIDTEIVIRHAGAGTFEMARAGRDRDIVLRARDDFRSGSDRLQVIRDREGQVTGLSVTRDRIRNVVFERH